MRIFVAGPWGDYAGVLPETIMANIRRADETGQMLVHLGHEVYIPHTMCRTWSGKFTQQEMERLDKSFLDHWAEAIYRVEGESVGADAEVAYAQIIGLKVLEQVKEVQFIIGGKKLPLMNLAELKSGVATIRLPNDDMPDDREQHYNEKAEQMP